VLDHSGDDQQWPPLQGSINLFLTRYLHLETDLWLNTGGDYLPGGWRMPAPPFGPPSLVIEEEAEIDISAAIDALSTGGAADPAAVPADDPGQAPEAAMGGDASPRDTTPAPGEMAAAAAPVYPFRHAVQLQQTRRMRSGEVHYIDHPLLGIIVKLTPVTAQDLSAVAVEQQNSPVASQLL
jgi:hypothetical protein